MNETPNPLKNIIFSGFFTIDVRAKNINSITSIKQHFASLIKNANNNISILTNIYLNNINIENNQIKTSLQKVKDNSNNPITLNFYNNNSNISLIFNEIDCFIDGKYTKYPSTTFLLDINTIKQDKILTFDIDPNNIYSGISVQSHIGKIPDKIQIEIGSGNIKEGWINNKYTIYNPFSANIYNNHNAMGNEKSSCWIIFSSDT